MEFLWGEGELHLRVFWAVERCLEVKTFDAGAGIAGVFGTNDAVPQHVGGGEVGGACGDFPG